MRFDGDAWHPPERALCALPVGGEGAPEGAEGRSAAVDMALARAASSLVSAASALGSGAARSYASLLGDVERQASRLRLNALADNPGAKREAKRVGRGAGSGKGKTAGRGHKGQKARSGESTGRGRRPAGSAMRQRARAAPLPRACCPSAFALGLASSAPAWLHAP